MTQMFMMANYIRKMTVKRSWECSRYGSFEHLLFMLTFSTTVIDFFDLGWQFESQQKAKLVGFIFLHVVQLIRMIFYLM